MNFLEKVHLVVDWNWTRVRGIGERKRERIMRKREKDVVGDKTREGRSTAVSTSPIPMAKFQMLA